MWIDEGNVCERSVNALYMTTMRLLGADEMEYGRKGCVVFEAFILREADGVRLQIPQEA